MLAFLNVWEKNIFNLPLPNKIVVLQRRIFWYFFNGCFIKCGGDIFNLQFTQWRKSRLSLEVKEFTQSKEAGADLVKSDFEIIVKSESLTLLFKKWKRKINFVRSESIGKRAHTTKGSRCRFGIIRFQIIILNKSKLESQILNKKNQI